MGSGGPRHKDGNNRFNEHTSTVQGGDTLSVTLPEVEGKIICIKGISFGVLGASGSGTLLVEGFDSRQLLVIAADVGAVALAMQILDIAADENERITVSLVIDGTLNPGTMIVTYCLYNSND